MSEYLQLMLRHLGYREWQHLDSPGLEDWPLGNGTAKAHECATKAHE